MSFPADAPATAVDSGPLVILDEGAARQAQPRIDKWAVVGHDRIVGTLANRSSAADGRTVITSPVVHVRLMGESLTPVAFTQSGSAYWLGEPAGHFGTGQAEHFIWFKSRRIEAQPAQVDPMMRTGVFKLG